jgi:hypothetical protein
MSIIGGISSVQSWEDCWLEVNDKWNQQLLGGESPSNHKRKNNGFDYIDRVNEPQKTWQRLGPIMRLNQDGSGFWWWRSSETLLILKVSTGSQELFRSLWFTLCRQLIPSVTSPISDAIVSSARTKHKRVTMCGKVLNSSRGTMPHHRANPLVPHLLTVRVTFIY